LEARACVDLRLIGDHQWFYDTRLPDDESIAAVGLAANWYY
jgi:hypothetical protein